MSQEVAAKIKQGSHQDGRGQGRLLAAGGLTLAAAVLGLDAVPVHCVAVELGLEVLEVEREVEDVGVGDLQGRAEFSEQVYTAFTCAASAGLYDDSSLTLLFSGPRTRAYPLR